MSVNPEIKTKQEITLELDSDFESVFRHNFVRLCSYAQRFVPEIGDAKDIVQFTFSKLWEARDSWPTILNVEAYLFRSVHNNCLDYLRHQKVKSKYRETTINKSDENDWMHFADNNTGLNQLQHSDLQKAVKNAVNDLPEQCRKIFVLSRFSGKKYAEIAEELNLSVKTVEAQMSIAFKRLRVALVDFMTILVVIGIATFFH